MAAVIDAFIDAVIDAFIDAVIDASTKNKKKKYLKIIVYSSTDLMFFQRKLKREIKHLFNFLMKILKELNIFLFYV
jgi:hypothetical protein